MCIRDRFYEISNRYDAILIVDEAHSSGVIGKNLLGWFDHHKLKPQHNHIKMGTLGKAYGSYGAYILASKEIISFLENRAKPIIYSTAASLFDIALGYENFLFIQNHTQDIRKKILQYQKIIEETLDYKTNSLIVALKTKGNKTALRIQNTLLESGYFVGAIRQPTVKTPIVRVVIKLDIQKKTLRYFGKLLRQITLEDHHPLQL